MKRKELRQQLIGLGSGGHAVALQLLGNADDAADAVQDVMLTVLSQPGRYDPRKGPLRPWFLRLVRNRCIDQLRRMKPRGALPDEAADASQEPDSLLDRSDERRQLRAALAELSPDHRQLVVLRDHLDMPYAEIAIVLDIKAGTVMSRLHRARQALRAAYVKLGEA